MGVMNLLKNPTFARAFAELGRVSLNPRRHTAANAGAHSEAVAALAARLACRNGCSPGETELLTRLGLVHDIGKVTGSARPERSLEVLAECGVNEPELLALVKWHDTSLPWHRAASRGEAPSEKAWRRLASEVDLRLLCLFMVADRVDAPGGWRRNAPTTWFLSEAQRRGWVGELACDLPDHPSELCAGAALVTRDHLGPELLVIRTRGEGFELPKGGIEWDELPAEAGLRELREESGVSSALEVSGELGSLDYFVGAGSQRRLKRVRYFVVRASGDVGFGPLPAATRERRWVRRDELEGLPLTSEALRPLLDAALYRPD